MSNYFDDIYGEVEMFKDDLPEGCEEAWADSKKRNVIIKWNDGTYRAAIFVDTEDGRDEAKSLGLPSFQLDEDFLFYVVDVVHSCDLIDALTRLKEWNDEADERIEKSFKQILEESRRRLGAE